MTLRQLRAAHARACRMHRITRSRGWERAVKRLCTEIMARCRGASSLRSSGEKRGEARAQ